MVGDKESSSSTSPLSSISGKDPRLAAEDEDEDEDETQRQQQEWEQQAQQSDEQHLEQHKEDAASSRIPDDEHLTKATSLPSPPPSAPKQGRQTRSGGVRKPVPTQASVKKPTPKKAPLKKPKWDAENILVDPKSPLAEANLRALLSNPMAWDVLDAPDQAEILALFPDQAHILESGTNKARPDFKSLMNDDTFRHDCATYTEHVAEGRFDPDWLASAWAAHEQRKTGDFDDHLVAKFENDWQTDLPEGFKPRRNVPVAEANNSPSVETKEAEEEQATPSKPNPKLEQHGYLERDQGIKNNHVNHAGGAGTIETRENMTEQQEAVRDAVDMVIDELQAEETKAPAPTKTIVSRHPAMMDIDGPNSEDELA